MTSAELDPMRTQSSVAPLGATADIAAPISPRHSTRVVLQAFLTAAAALFALPAAHAQSITAGALDPIAVPTGHPAVLLILALALCACAVVVVRKASATVVRVLALAAMTLGLAGTLIWGDAVKAQWQQLQRAFTRNGGETLAIPVQPILSAGVLSGFAPVQYSNQTASGLRVTAISLPPWNTCFAAGVPQTVPVTAPLPGTYCAVGTAMAVTGTCWVDVSRLCADVAGQVVGTHPTLVVGDLATVDAGATVSGNVLTNDSDADGPLAVASYEFQSVTYLAGQSANPGGIGALSLQGDGSYVFTAALPYTGGAALVVRYTTHTGASGTLTITVRVAQVNTPPTAQPDAATTSEDTPVTIAVRANDIDADGDALTVSAVTQGTHGAVAIDTASGDPRYTPAIGFVGSDSFSYTVSDGRGGTAVGSVAVTVSDVNHAPVANADAFSTRGNTPLTLAPGSLLGNDTDADGDTLVIDSVQSPSNGTVALSGGSVVFTPTAGYAGAAGFTYTIRDPAGLSATAAVTVAVVNSAPVAQPDAANTPESTAVTIGVRANDTDADGDTLTLTAVTQGAHGTVAIDAGSGDPRYTPAAGYAGGDSFTYSISDGHGGSANGTVTITISDVNHAPVANDDAFSTHAGTTLTLLPNQLLGNDTDPDGDTLVIDSVQAASNGTVSLQAGNVVFVPAAGHVGAAGFAYTVRDPAGLTDSATVAVTVTNAAPVASADTATTAEESPVVIAVRANDTDPDGDTLTVSAVTQGTSGEVVIDGATGNPRYTPVDDFAGSDSFSYTISDGFGGSASATVTVTVTAANDPPVANPDIANTAEDTPTTTTVRLNDSDADGDTLTVSTVTQGTNGSVVIDAGSGNPRYTPAPNFHGSDAYSYTVSDGNGGSATATVSVTVTPVNDAPVANADMATTIEDTPTTIVVRANDTDADADTLTVTTVTQGTNGSVVIDAGSGNPRYTPALNFHGSDTFTYTISDGNGGTATASVSVTVTPVNDAPVANADTATTIEDTLTTIVVRANDTDADGDTLTVITVTQGTNGSVVIDGGSGNPRYTPALNFHGSDTFTYTISDGSGSTATASVSVTVAPVNDAPVANPDTATTNEDTSVTIAVRVNDTDAEGDTLTVITVTQGTSGSVVIDAGSGNPIYTPNSGFDGSDAFTYTISDGSGGSATGLVNVTVNPVNHAPVANDDAFSIHANTTLSLTPAQLLVNDTDPDGDTLTIDSVQAASNGTVSLQAGNVVFVPATNHVGAAGFSYTVRDPAGATDTASVVVTVTNTAPVANADSAGTAEDTAVTIAVRANDTDADGDTLTVTTVTQGTNGSVAIDGVSGNPRYTPNLNFHGTDTFTYTISDGLGVGATANVTVTVTPVNDAPVANPDTATTAEDLPVLIAVRTNDTDAEGDPLGVMSVTQGAHGSVVIDGASGNPNYTPAPNFHGSDSFGYTISDGNGGSASGTVSITVTPVNDAPLANPDTATTAEDTPVVVTVLANDTDIDGDTLSLTSVTQSPNGTVVIDSGTARYTPNADFFGTDAFDYTVSDGNGGSATATATVTVTPVNEPPVANDDSATTRQNQALFIPITTLLANDTDPDDDTLTFVSVQGAVNGTASRSGSNIVFTPTANFEGSASFIYTIQDASGATDTATVTVVVGSAGTPELVVLKSRVAVAHGTGGVSVDFPIVTWIYDTDGSETLSIRISNVPTGTSFSAGVNLGGGVWRFAPADLPNLTINLPGSYTTPATHLTVQATSTEINGGVTASVSSVVTVKAAYTTVDITTTQSGSYTGSSANEFIQGGTGNNTINGSNGNNIVNGGGGDDNLSAGSGSDEMYGGSGNDTINAGSGSDVITGGSGNDTLIGGDAGENFVDVFVWELGDQGASGTPAIDTIQNFATAAAGSNTTGGDVIYLRDLLQAESPASGNGGNLPNYLHFEINGSDTLIHISHTGGFSADSHSIGGAFNSSAETQTIRLVGVNLQSLYSGASTDNQIITQLLNNNKLMTH